MTDLDPSKFKNVIGISEDHSASMRGLTHLAARDYNRQIATITSNAIQHQQDTIVSVVSCGAGHTDKIARTVVNSSVIALKPVAEALYEARGRGTPLYDSVGDLIEQFEAMPDANDPNVSFIVLVITDGEENSSKKWSGRELAEKIRQLQNTDRWTFIFRVPKGATQRIVRNLGVHPGNVQEWDQTEKGITTSSEQTAEAFNTFFADRAAGKKSTKSFYTSLADVDPAQIKASLTDISSQVQYWEVQTASEGALIKPFIEHKLGHDWIKGAGFYELTKTEKAIQDYKVIIIRDKNTGVFYSSKAARQLLGLPSYGSVRVVPGDHGDYEIFIQSTSVNRKLPVGSHVVYWPNFNG